MFDGYLGLTQFYPLQRKSVGANIFLGYAFLTIYSKLSNPMNLSIYCVYLAFGPICLFYKIHFDFNYSGSVERY